MLSEDPNKITHNGYEPIHANLDKYNVRIKPLRSVSMTELELQFKVLISIQLRSKLELTKHLNSYVWYK